MDDHEALELLQLMNFPDELINGDALDVAAVAGNCLQRLIADYLAEQLVNQLLTD